MCREVSNDLGHVSGRSADNKRDYSLLPIPKRCCCSLLKIEVSIVLRVTWTNYQWTKQDQTGLLSRTRVLLISTLIGIFDFAIPKRYWDFRKTDPLQQIMSRVFWSGDQGTVASNQPPSPYCQPCIQFCFNSHFKWRLALASLYIEIRQEGISFIYALSGPLHWRVFIISCSYIQFEVEDPDLQIRGGAVIQTLRWGGTVSKKLFFEPSGLSLG